MIVELLVLLAQATAADAPPATVEQPSAQVETTAPAAPAAETPQAEQRVCRSVLPTGSRRPVRVCTTASEDAEAEQDSETRRTMMRATQRGAPPPSLGGRGG